MEIVTADIGGTNARFALARIEDGRVAGLSDEAVFKTAEHAGLNAVWRAYAGQLGRPMPHAGAVAIAGPVRGDTLKLTNTGWVIRVDALRQDLRLDALTLVNDFAAVAHAVSHLPESQLRTICGPEIPLPSVGVISVVGPGTGLGAAQILRSAVRYDVIATESGHIGFAPADEIEDEILAHLRLKHGRVSLERIVSGPGLGNIYAVLAARENRPPHQGDDRSLWDAALSGRDKLAAAALERFCLCLGGCAGDLALAHGAMGVVVGGGLGLRLADVLPRSRFAERFVAKGRFEAMMSEMPVKLITHPQPGLLGAAAAFALEHAAP